MKIFAGKHWALLALTQLLAGLLLLGSAQASARISVEADRVDIAMGETLRLTITADAGEQPDDLDLAALERDFEILQRSSATSARIVGGQQSVTRTLELELAPRRDGLLTIPSMAYSGRQTTPIAVKVAPQPQFALDDELVYFDAEVDRTEVYVQAQVILTITLQQAINLDNRAVSELDIPNTYVEALEQKSFQRRAAGRLWQVTELRYALFPQQSGSLTIPPIAFSGRELLPGRSLLGARLGRRIAIESEAIKLQVKPVPASFPGDVWLPARRLDVSQRWSATPTSLSVGDSTTRSIEITAEGLQGSQLPPISSLGSTSGIEGLRFYPDQETIEQREIPVGIEGYRLQSEALVATEPGQWRLPELVIPWWNTETDTLEYARIPAESVAVAGAATNNASLDNAPGSDEMLGFSSPASGVLLWQVLAGAGWFTAICLGFYGWRARRHPAAVTRQPTVKTGFKLGSRELVPLRLACSANDPSAARDALLVWGQRYLNRETTPTLQQLSESVSPELGQEIRRLDAALYASGGNTWQGNTLFGLVRDVSAIPPESADDSLQLYPTG